jgi:hypothetical protein
VFGFGLRKGLLDEKRGIDVAQSIRVQNNREILCLLLMRRVWVWVWGVGDLSGTVLDPGYIGLTIFNDHLQFERSTESSEIVLVEHFFLDHFVIDDPVEHDLDPLVESFGIKRHFLVPVHQFLFDQPFSFFLSLMDHLLDLIDPLFFCQNHKNETSTNRISKKRKR